MAWKAGTLLEALDSEKRKKTRKANAEGLDQRPFFPN
jgi:hypothetical protein